MSDEEEVIDDAAMVDLGDDDLDLDLGDDLDLDLDDDLMVDEEISLEMSSDEIE